jgi:hypothetical protein
MPAIDRDKKVLEEGQTFTNKKSQYPQPCLHHKPTLEELKEHSFSDFVRHVVLKKAMRKTYEDDAENINLQDLISRSKPIPYRHGIAKVSLPDGFTKRKEPLDTTARGPQWDAGTPLGDKEIPSPIKQCIRGIGGIYEYTFMDQDPMSVADFRAKADEYLSQQVGTKELSVEMLERKFWKRLGPTMLPSWYGADMEGTLFGDDDSCGWNIAKLHSCLQLLLAEQPHDDDTGGIPGVTTPYLYFGMWASVFCAHTEDMNLLSINYLHAGAPKVWYAIAAGEDAQRFEQLCEGHYHQAKSLCDEYLRHKRTLVSPAVLKKAGIPFTTTVQYPGDAVITFPGSYHFGFNTGFNVAEATNFAVPEWIAYGRAANVCLCRPDSVRIDMGKFERLMQQYEAQPRKHSRRILWKDWARQLSKKNNVTVDHESPRKSGRMGGVNDDRDDDDDDEEAAAAKELKKDFWIEVVEPIVGKGSTTDSSHRKRNNRKRKKQKAKTGEIWHLAKHVGRRILRPSARVLCVVPAVVEEDRKSKVDSESDDEEDEQCFAGTITEVSEDHVRVHFDGLPKKDDVWMPLDSPKLFLDGGRWEENPERSKLPAKHFWREEDSKRRCV